MLRWPFAPRRAHVAEKLEPQAAYALWADTYPPYAHNALMALEQRTVLSLLPNLAGRTVIDAGCGSGRYLQELRKLGAAPVGLDLSEPMLAKARAITSRVARANLCALPIESASVDVIVCGLALGDVPNLEMAMNEMARVLRAGGCVVYSVVHPTGGSAGWLRTFEAQGRVMSIDGYWHTAEEHRQACAAAGLTITAWEEPGLAEWVKDPVVLVARASKRRRTPVEPPLNRCRTIG
jgi:malonyl-CoA O-methyltransferase